MNGMVIITLTIIVGMLSWGYVVANAIHGLVG